MKDDEIQKKLVELETAILKQGGPEEGAQVIMRDEPGTSLAGVSEPKLSESARSDLHYFGGIFLLLVGVIMLFQHVRVTTGMMTYWGMSAGNSIGMLLILLILGIGWIIYNSKSIWGWMISALSFCTIIFTIVSGLRIYFAPISMLGMIFMLLPFAFGSAFLLKGIGGPKGVEEVLRSKLERRQ